MWNVCCNISFLPTGYWAAHYAGVGWMFTLFGCTFYKHTIQNNFFRHLKSLAMTEFEPAQPWKGFEPFSPHHEGRELPFSLHGALPLSYMALKIILHEGVVNWRMVAR